MWHIFENPLKMAIGWQSFEATRSLSIKVPANRREMVSDSLPCQASSRPFFDPTLEQVQRVLPYKRGPKTHVSGQSKAENGFRTLKIGAFYVDPDGWLSFGLAGR